MLHALRQFAGFLLAALALLVTLIGTFAVIAMGMVWWQDGGLGERERLLLSRGGGAMVAGALLTWAGFRLAHGKRGPADRERRHSFRLGRSKSGRQERFVEVFTLFVYLVFFGGWLWSRVEGEPWQRAGQVAGWLAVVYLGLHLRVLLHELGHLSAARLLRMEPATLRVGVGPKLQDRLGRSGLRWEWRLRPTGGWVEAFHPDESGFRGRQFRFVLGGPLVDALLIGALWMILRPAGGPSIPPGAAPSAARAVAWVLFGVLALSAVIGLVPHRTFIDNRTLYSDGWWLLRVFFVPADRVCDWVGGQAFSRVVWLSSLGRSAEARTVLEVAATRYPERRGLMAMLAGRMHRQENDPARAAACFKDALTVGAGLPPTLRPVMLADLAAALAATGQVEPARAECAAALAQTTDPAERVTLLEALACLPILQPDAKALLPDAGKWCREALTLTPGRLALRGTLGSLLVESGRDEEGSVMLREVLASTPSAEERGVFAVYLALAAHRLGQEPARRDYQRQARRYCTQPALLKRLSTELPAA